MSAVAALGASSGCSVIGDDTDRGDGGRAYRRFLPDTAADPPSPFRIRWLFEDRGGRQAGDRSTVWAAQSVLRANPTDRLLAGVLLGYVRELYITQEEYEPYPVFPDLGPTATPDDGDFDASIGGTEGLLRVADTTVFLGSYDVGELEARTPSFEGVEQVGSFTVFARDGTLPGATETPVRPQARVFAASPAAIVFPAANDRRALATLRRVLRTRRGEEKRLVDAGAGPGWAISAVGRGDIVFGLWTRRAAYVADLDLLAEAVPEAGFEDVPRVGPTRGEVYSVSRSPTELTGRFAAVYPEGRRPDRSTIEGAVGHTAASQEVTLEGRRVAVSATWRRSDSSTTSTGRGDQ